MELKDFIEIAEEEGTGVTYYAVSVFTGEQWENITEFTEDKEGIEIIYNSLVKAKKYIEDNAPLPLIIQEALNSGDGSYKP